MVVERCRGSCCSRVCLIGLNLCFVSLGSCFVLSSFSEEEPDEKGKEADDRNASYNTTNNGSYRSARRGVRADNWYGTGSGARAGI